MSDELLRAGRILAALPHPLSKSEVVPFAEKVAYQALVDVERQPGAMVECLSGLMLSELSPRGASLEQIEEIARLTLAVVRKPPALSISQAKHLVRGIWLGVLLAKRPKLPAVRLVKPEGSGMP
jgi:hypothetical protein